MQRVTWTDERLDVLSGRMDKGFERVDRRFEGVDREFRCLRAEMNQGFAELRGLMWRLNGGIFVAVVAAFLLRGL